MKLLIRWSAAITVALVLFLACWAGLDFGAGMDSGQALGWSVVPFTIGLTAGAAWADRARKTSDAASAITDPGLARPKRMVQKQRAAGDHSQQLQAGGDIRIEKK